MATAHVEKIRGFFLPFLSPSLEMNGCLVESGFGRGTPGALPKRNFSITPTWDTMDVPLIYRRKENASG